MEAPSTPPAPLRFGRMKTPPTPMYGPVIDTYDPYSPPRRSTRSTLQNNPYSSANVSTSSSSKSSASSNNLPPLTPKTPAARKLSFSISEALSTPPASPMQLRVSSIAGRNNCSEATIADNGIPRSMTKNSSLAVPNPSSAMLPTPTKTPSLTPARKHQRAASMQDSARILHFQPENPNDVMPTPRESRKQQSATSSKMGAFDTAAHGSRRKAGSGFQIYTETQARVPEDDTSRDNVFRGRRTNSAPQQDHTRHWSSSPSPEPKAKTEDDIKDERRMDSAARRNEGAVYVFRGRKVYRRFDDTESVGPDLCDSSQQRALKRAAGESAQRPLTRSQITPRLLWPARPQEFDIDQGADIRQHDTADEEAETDIEMSDAPAIGSQQTPRKSTTSVSARHAGPAKVKGGAKPMLSPPTTAKTIRSKGVRDIPSFDETLEADDEAPASRAVPPTPQRSSRKKKVEISDIPVFHDATPEPIALDAEDVETPAPPMPARVKTKRVTTHLTPIAEDGEEVAVGSPAPARTSARRKVPSPFDNWPRTKPNRKREGEAIDAGSIGASAKRSRSGTRSAQA